MADSLTPQEISQILEEFFATVGTRQYIGARYVPIFGRKNETSILWDNTAPYEPLTIVLYQGNSYTSRQYVPASVDISNTDFWALTGNYNAQVEQYRTEVAEFQDRLESVEDATADLTERVEDAEATVDGFSTTISEHADSIQANTSAIESQAAQIAGTSDSGLKSLINANTDSISDNASAIAANVSDIATNADAISDNASAIAAHTDQLAGTSESGLKTLIAANQSAISELQGEIGGGSYNGAKSIGFGDSNMAGGEAGATENVYYQICQKLGCTYDNRGINGATFSTSGSSTIKSAIDSATADNDVKLVVLIGGINDYHYVDYNVSTYKSSVLACVNPCLTKYPNADICLIWDQGKQHPNARMLRYPHAMAACANASRTRKIVVVPTFDLCFEPSLYVSQNHWNSGGCSVVAQRACALLTGGSLYPAFTYRLAVAPSGSISGCNAIVQKIANLDSYTIDQYADLNFNANWGVSGSFTTLFELPMGIDGNLASGDKYFDDAICLADNKNLFLNFRQFAANYESLVDSPVLTVRNRYAVTDVSHPAIGCRISIPLRPQQ